MAAIRSPGTCSFPFARVRRIVKEDKQVQAVSADALFLIALTTELFLQQLAQCSSQSSLRDKRKTLMYKDVAEAVTNYEAFEFLQEIIPPQIPFQKAIQLRQQLKQDKGYLFIHASPPPPDDADREGEGVEEQGVEEEEEEEGE